MASAFPLQYSQAHTATPNHPSRIPLKRRESLLPTQPPHIPVPPSLLQSPYLNSPESIFKRELSTPRLPSKEDEQWLQDTVPLSFQTGEEELEQERRGVNAMAQRSTGTGMRQEASNDERAAARGRSSKTRPPAHAAAAPSPPLVHWRQMPAGYKTRPQWLGQGQTMSEPDVARLLDHGYFPSVAPLR